MSYEWHVATEGRDTAGGSADEPVRTITRAAALARPGDVVTVHAGTYRERVTPPRGGTSPAQRITYRAARDERVIITGAEIVSDWTSAGDGVWRTVITDEFVRAHGDGSNPFRDRLGGDWFRAQDHTHHRGALVCNGEVGYEVDCLEDLSDPKLPTASCRWHVGEDADGVVLHASFGELDPRRGSVEAMIRSTVFTPAHAGVDFITVQGFELCHAATPWAPPTAAQIGILGPHWARGWVIEDNHIHGARCSGVSLGQDGSLGENRWTEERVKHGTQRQRETVFRALHRGWSRDTVGGHVVRRNHIHGCEQTGVVGHLGCIHSRILHNYIHDIHVHRRFGGAEIAGIKLHAAIDCLIAHNRVEGADRGIWLDWQAQGTRVHANLISRCDLQDFFIEVSHGPTVVDHNILLSAESILNVAQGTCFAHNLIAGTVKQLGVPNRFTPYHLPHSTAVAGLMTILGGDDRWYNNLFLPTGEGAAARSPEAGNSDFAGIDAPRVSHGTAVYDGFPVDGDQWKTARTPNDYAALRLPVFVGNNGYGEAGRPWEHEANPVVSAATVSAGGASARAASAGAASAGAEGESIVLTLFVDTALAEARAVPVDTDMLGQAFQSEAVFEDYDGRPLRLDRDYHGKPHAGHIGPFADLAEGENRIVVWTDKE